MLTGMTLDEIKALGLDAQDIKIHQERITQGLQHRDQLFIPIEDTCRLDNGGIIPARYLQDLKNQKPEGFVAFVPAAGAASRYFKPLADFRAALATQNAQEIASQHRLLRNQGCETWPVGPALRSYFKQDPGSTPKAQSIAEMIEEIDQPKALQPCWTDGPSFLQIKSEEHRHIKGIEAEYYVAPLGLSEDFHTHLKQDAKLPSYFLEQGTDLSTLRFLPNGLPYRDESGQVSVVPAGHGMLVRLFKKIHSTTKNAHSLLIRNIDNVTGFSQEFIGETELFLVQHQIVLLAVQNIRKALQSDDLSEASRFAGDLLQNMLNPRPLKPGSWLTELTEPWSSLWRLLVQGFHCPESHAHKLRLKHQDKRALKELYARPVNTLGQVPNSGKDVGGTPVFARSTAGEVSICLELPHVSPIDRQRFLEDPTRATHFNPVFVAAEIPTSTKAYELENCPFWILADKTIHGQAVVYHEIVLYEVIGNSLTANVQFPVISRRLFKPHKSLFDGLKAQI